MRDPYSSGARAIGIVLRTSHLFAMAIFLGGVHLGAAAASIRPWRLATVATGAVLLLAEMSHGRGWIHQVRGVAAAAHVGVLALLAFGGMERPACTLALVIGALGSHAPRSIRKFSLRYGRAADGERG
ncbi:MAG TPA: hypothetical protein VIV57_05695 [Anaeromyxobacter sp.]